MFMGSPMCIVLEAAAGFGQQLRSHRQITLGRVQVGMSEIDGQRWQKYLHVRASPIPFRQSVDGERVAQIVKPRLTRTCVTASNSRKDAEAAEVCVYRIVAKALMLPRLEKGLVVLIPSPWRSQVLAKKLLHRRRNVLVTPLASDNKRIQARSRDLEHQNSAWATIRRIFQQIWSRSTLGASSRDLQILVRAIRRQGQKSRRHR